MSFLKRVRIAFAICVAAGAAGGVFAILQAGLLSRVIGRVFLSGYTLHEVLQPMILLLAVMLCRAVCAWASERAGAAAARRVKLDLREQINQKLFRLGPVYAQERPAGEVAVLAVQGVDALDAYFSQYLPQVVLAGLVPLAVLAFVFPRDWISGAILLVTGPLIPVFMFLIGSHAERLTGRQFHALSRLSAFFLDTLQGLRALKELGRSREQVEQIRKAGEEYRQATLSVLRVTFTSALALELLGTISTALIAVQVGLRLLRGAMFFEDAFFLLVIAPDFYLPLRTLGLRFHAGMNGVSSARRIFELLAEPEPAAGSRAAGLKKIRLSGKEIVFDAVRYRYRGRSEPALDGFDLRIEPGELVALVGESGVGKSTAVALLMRFIDPQEGMIRVGGVDLREIDPQAWRGQIAWVPQEPHWINGTIAENLRIANQHAGMSEWKAACEKARLLEWIQSLPDGFETQIGERGSRMSGGQAQRLALARAFLRDAPFVVMDEPAAHIDPLEDALIAEAIRALCHGRGGLVIAHRLGTVAKADRIAVLQAGKVAECGDHAALKAAGGLSTALLRSAGGAE